MNNQSSIKNKKTLPSIFISAFIALTMYGCINDEKIDYNITTSSFQNKPITTKVKFIKKYHTESAEISKFDFQNFYDCTNEQIYTSKSSKKLSDSLSKCSDSFLKGKTSGYLNLDSFFKDVSLWDGSYRPLKEYINNNMHDSGSFKHENTSWSLYKSKKSHILVRMKYSGNNAFGARVKSNISAKFDLKDKQLTIVGK